MEIYNAPKSETVVYPRRGLQLALFDPFSTCGLLFGLNALHVKTTTSLLALQAYILFAIWQDFISFFNIERQEIMLVRPVGWWVMAHFMLRCRRLVLKRRAL